MMTLKQIEQSAIKHEQALKDVAAGSKDGLMDRLRSNAKTDNFSRKQYIFWTRLRFLGKTPGKEEELEAYIQEQVQSVKTHRLQRLYAEENK